VRKTRKASTALVVSQQAEAVAPGDVFLDAFVRAIREASAHDPSCPFNADFCRTAPIDIEYAMKSRYAKAAGAIISVFLMSPGIDGLLGGARQVGEKLKSLSE
jgi:hypothetical protein